MDRDGAAAAGLPVRFWDFLFYASFGFVVTSSVAIAGVLLVFCYLIVPSVAAMLYADRIGPRLAIGWTMGTVVSALGVYLSLQARSADRRHHRLHVRHRAARHGGAAAAAEAGASGVARRSVEQPRAGREPPVAGVGRVAFDAGRPRSCRRSCSSLGRTSPAQVPARRRRSSRSPPRRDRDRARYAVTLPVAVSIQTRPRRKIGAPSSVRTTVGRDRSRISNSRTCSAGRFFRFHEKRGCISGCSRKNANVGMLKFRDPGARLCFAPSSRIARASSTRPRPEWSNGTSRPRSAPTGTPSMAVTSRTPIASRMPSSRHPREVGEQLTPRRLAGIAAVWRHVLLEGLFADDVRQFDARRRPRARPRASGRPCRMAEPDAPTVTVAATTRQAAARIGPTVARDAGRPYAVPLPVRP